jgi:hypothetical protein
MTLNLKVRERSQLLQPRWRRRHIKTMKMAQKSRRNERGYDLEKLWIHGLVQAKERAHALSSTR